MPKIKFTKADRVWSKKVKSRDDNQCVICGQTKFLNAHHILPRENKKLKHELRNGISLCPSHHRFSRTISAHQNPVAFQMWMELNRKHQMQWIKEQIKQEHLHPPQFD